MGKLNEEELERLKDIVYCILCQIRINSVIEVIATIIYLGQYCQYIYAKYDNGVYLFGAGIVSEIRPDSVPALLATCRNLLVHPKITTKYSLMSLHDMLMDNKDDIIFKNDVLNNLINQLTDFKDWDLLYSLFDSSDKSVEFEDAIKMLGLE